MKLITRDTDYAVRIILFMSKKKDGAISASDLVAKLAIPRAFLRKILQELGRAKILKSQKGKGGGFVLNVSPEKIKIINLIEVFQGKIEFSDCLFKKKICPNQKTCALRHTIKKIEKKVVNELKGVTLSSLSKG